MLLLLLVGPALSQAPKRVVPPEVLVEVELLEGRFEEALALDCEPSECFSKGCAYVAHAVADQPRSSSLPGLGQPSGPSAAEAQNFLTRARCAYATESTLEADHIAALTRRLQTRVSSGWAVVSVTSEPLAPLPEVEPIEESEVVEVAEPIEAPPSWSAQLWDSLLPHFWWMIGIGLATLAAFSLIWAWRRLGRISAEEQALLAQMALEEEPTEVAEAEVELDGPEAQASDQALAWQARMEAADPSEMQALVQQLLRSGEHALLAKAVMRFPNLAAAFPVDGELAAAKLELANYVTSVDTDALPDDDTFFDQLNRHALSAALSSQTDTSMLRSLQEEFGPSGLAQLIGAQGPRVGGLLFALSPAAAQHEVVRLLSSEERAGCAQQLLRSNRMDQHEAAHLFAVLEAVRAGNSPHAPERRQVSDRGAAFDAAAALSILMDQMSGPVRSAVLTEALQSSRGSLPAWTHDILFGAQLLSLPAEARADMLLEVELDPAAAWLSQLDNTTRARLLEAAPSSLLATLDATTFPNRARQLALAEQGRKALSRAYQRQLARAGLSVEQALEKIP